MVKKELDKLAKLLKSKRGDKIKTCCYFKLPDSDYNKYIYIHIHTYIYIYIYIYWK
jgi:hypothetical protein